MLKPIITLPDTFQTYINCKEDAYLDDIKKTIEALSSEKILFLKGILKQEYAESRSAKEIVFLLEETNTNTENTIFTQIAQGR